jgi:hypothetical protein
MNVTTILDNIDQGGRTFMEVIADTDADLHKTAG